MYFIKAFNVLNYMLLTNVSLLRVKKNITTYYIVNMFFY